MLEHHKEPHVLLEIAKKMAGTRASILITGESGTGKELFAQAIHNASDRRLEPFIALNCGALPENLLESELFGYVDGAFTGAKKGGRLGLFEFAHKGTLFLDEVEGMSPMLQVKLLRVIQEHEVMRLGDTRLISIDVRIIAATNRDLEQLVQKGEFREDLYYRLNTLPIIPLIHTFAEENGSRFQLSGPVCEALKGHYWRGNVRELKNCADYFSFLDKKVIEYEDLPPGFFHGRVKPEKEPVHDCQDNTILEFRQMTSPRQEAYLFVLSKILESNKGRVSISRERLSGCSCEKGLDLSVYEVREILSDLDSMGYIMVRKGRGGSRITDKGKHVLHYSGLNPDGKC